MTESYPPERDLNPPDGYTQEEEDLLSVIDDTVGGDPSDVDDLIRLGVCLDKATVAVDELRVIWEAKG